MRSRPAAKECTGSSEIRCAIYTRKSSEEGLEQEFNSLHAQREACQAYILSQRHEGWRALPALYDDGGVSGGTMDRPALARLLGDIRAKRLDLIVIYKVDRLTRSLADFAKLVDVFNASNVSFVSVTQQFNTATSMGRLTLNMLLSFAQFEREVTGERIRDKIAASKRKGMWMGGYPPLGYDVRDRKLVVNQSEAAQVERIFRRYTELGSVRLLQEQLAAEGITTKLRTSPDGSTGGGRPLLRGNLYEMLQNRLYRGEVAHKGQVYPGEQQAIIDPALWDQVQAGLSERRIERSTGSRCAQPSLLTGFVYDAAGRRLTPSHARKGSKRYRYYISKSLISDAAAKADGLRLPAGELDALVIGALLRLIRTPGALLEAVGQERLDGVEQRQLLLAAHQPCRGVGPTERSPRAVHCPGGDRPCRGAFGFRDRQRDDEPANRSHPGQERAASDRHGREPGRAAHHLRACIAAASGAGDAAGRGRGSWPGGQYDLGQARPSRAPVPRSAFDGAGHGHCGAGSFCRCLRLAFYPACCAWAFSRRTS